MKKIIEVAWRNKNDEETPNIFMGIRIK